MPILDPSEIFRLSEELSSLQLRAEEALHSLYQGDYRSYGIGQSNRFSEHREYVQGDPVKDIDWKVYARTDKYFVKKYEHDSRHELCLILDTSTSMQFSSAVENDDEQVTVFTKIDYAKTLLACLALLAKKAKNSCALYAFDSELRELSPSAEGAEAIAKLIANLAQKETEKNSDFAQAASELRFAIPAKSTVIIASDFLCQGVERQVFLDSLREWKYKSCQVIVLHIVDSLEAGIDMEGQYQFFDPENKSQEQDFDAQVQANIYRNRFLEFQGSLADELTAMGAQYHYIQSDMAIVDSLRSVLIKNQNLLFT